MLWLFPMYYRVWKDEGAQAGHQAYLSGSSSQLAPHDKFCQVSVKIDVISD